MRTADVIKMRNTETLTTCEPFSGPREPDAEMHIRRLADTLHRLNQQILTAVEAGLTVEVVRASRHHNGRGAWGDQMVPVIRMTEPMRSEPRE